MRRPSIRERSRREAKGGAGDRAPMVELRRGFDRQSPPRGLERQRLHGLLLEGVASPSAVTADGDYFGRLHDRLHDAGQR